MMRNSFDNLVQIQKQIHSWILVIGVFLFSLIVHGQIQTEIDTAHIKIGEPIKYELRIPLASSKNIQIPNLKDTLSFHIEILDQKIDTIFEGEKKTLVQRLTLTSFDPGEFLIRSLPIIVDNDTFLSQSFQIKVDEVKIDSANLVGFPIKPLMEEEYTWKDYWDKYWIYFAIGTLVFLALLVVAILFLRDKKRKEIIKNTPKTPYEEAMISLKNLDKRNHLEKAEWNPYYSELSFLLRRYLGKIYKFSSLELLSDDLVAYFKTNHHLENEDLERLKTFLYDSDLAKFAKSVPDEHLHSFYRKWVEGLIEKTKPLQLEDESVQELRPDEKYRKLS